MITIMILALFFTLFLVFWFWHSPARRKLTGEEIDRYLGAALKLPLPSDEMTSALTRMRAWAEADDGKPFYMLNLMRYYRETRSFLGAPDFQGTPEQANARYEKGVAMLLFKRAGYPVVGGKVQGRSLLQVPADVDNWGRVIVVRYPSRRAFLSLLADPGYARYEPYKFMALRRHLCPYRKA